MSGSVLNTVGRTIFELGMVLSPVILTGGIASKLSLPALPIIALTEAVNFLEGVLSNPTAAINPDNFFAHFDVMPGGTMVDQQIGLYPFANQATAANAVMSQPLQLSLKMICPAKQQGGMAAKLITLSALQYALELHNASGGLYTIVTPSLIYTNMVMLRMTDITNGDTKQRQVEWQMDFLKPLVTTMQGDSVMNSLMQKLTGGMATTGSITSVGSSVVSAGSSVLGMTAPVIPVTSVPLPGLL